MRVIGLDIHRIFAEVAAVADGQLVRRGRVALERERLLIFARTLTRDDHVVIEATGNAAAVAEILKRHVGRVVVANPGSVH